MAERQDLGNWRRETDRIAAILQQDLEERILTLQPVFAPAKYLGKYAGGSDAALQKRAIEHIREAYQKVARDPYKLSPSFEERWLKDLSPVTELYPFTYLRTVVSGDEEKELRIKSPVRWMINYKSGYSPSDIRATVQGERERQVGPLRNFVLGAIALEFLFANSPDLTGLFERLGYRVESAPLDGFGALPLTTIRFRLPAELPEDDVIFQATALTGIDQFEELIDTSEVENLEDPIKQKLL